MKKQFSICILAIIAFICVESQATSKVPHYPSRAPLAENPFVELNIGEIQPEGWLRAQIETMRDGLTGHLDEIYPEVMGPRNGWLGGDGDVWERGPYWIDGLLPLAYILSDKELIKKVKPGYWHHKTRKVISAPKPTVPKRKVCSATMPATGGPRWLCSKFYNSIIQQRVTSESSRL